jgi:hypothetical protein
MKNTIVRRIISLLLSFSIIITLIPNLSISTNAQQTNLNGDILNIIEAFKFELELNEEIDMPNFDLNDFHERFESELMQAIWGNSAKASALNSIIGGL